MSTRCRIGILNKDGTITSIYCHHDGYMKGGVGERLVVHYTDEAKIRKLLELGDISSLGTEPVENPKAFQTPGLMWSVTTWSKVWHELNPEDTCNCYKTRGDICPAQTHKSIKEYQKYSRDCWGEYTYLFKDGKWYDLNDTESVDVAKEIDKGEY